MRHALRWAGIVLSIVAGTVLGATGVALGTSAGRAIVVSTALQVVNGAIEGTLTVGWVTGSLRRGLEARQVSVVGRDGVPLVQIPSLSIRYRLRDLVSRRFVLGQVSVESPRVNVVKGRDGRFNFERIFRLGGGKGGGSRPLVAFHDVEIDSGTIWIRVPANSGDTATDEGGLELDGGSRLRRIENFSARLSYVRLSSPFPREDAILADIRDLRARLSDPRLVIRGAAGRAQVWSDSARLDLPRLVLGTSQAKVGGTVGWPADTLMFNLALETRDAALDDVRPLVPAIPRGLDGSGRFTVHSLAGDVLALGAEQMAIVGRHGGGSLTGRAGIVLGPRGSWSVRRADLELADLDLEYVRGIFDTLPVAGRLSGTVKADGPHDHLAVEADVAFRDSLVPGWPVSTARAGGVLRVGDAEGLVFQDVSLGEAKIDLATVRRLVPGIALRGSLGLQGRVSGPWLEVQFDGTLRHVDPPAPETAAHTVIQLDARGDTLGVWAKMSFDSLRLAGLRSLLPDFKVEGAFAGDVLLEGYADSLHFTSDLAGPSGHLAGSGSLILISPHYAVRYLNVRFAALDVHQLFAQAPTTRLNGETRGAIETDTLRASTAAFMVRLDSSLVEQSRIDSMTGTVSLADSVVRIDTLMGWAPDAQFTMAGGLGVRLPRRDSLMIAADLRSLRFLDPALRRILAVPDDSTRQPPSGGVRVRASISGALDDYRIAGNVASSEFQWERWSAHGAQLQGSWSSKARGAVTLAAVMDSLRSGTPEFNSITLRVSGARDSVRWIGRARSGSQSTIMLSGSLVTDSTTVRVPLDSARFTLAAAAWVLEKRTTIVVGDSAIDLGALTLNETSGASRIEAVGSIPMEGHGRLTLSLQTVPLTDLFALAQKDPSGAAGTLAGTIDLAGTARAPQMHAALSMIDVAYGDFRVPAIQGVIDYAGHRLQGEFKLRRAQDVIMDITADLPIDLALRDPAANRQLPGQLKIRAVADSVDLAILEAVSPAVRDASGRLDGDFGITGSWERPQLTGSLNLTSGAATYPGLGVRHQGISGRVVMQGDTLHIERMSGRSGSGTLAVGGNVRLENLTRPVLDLHLSARDFDAMDVRTFLTFTATGEFDLRGPLIGATLSGSGTVPKGILHYTD
ncbi:MAG: translocation/assembly module TamB domain-containing protein, partial [Gemmatimonadetes bacterium]|nr:translocation/assembly module TamB domain-containing protein [Gemmatimonadota bacterium]